jgi:hypothetical protein
MLAETPLKDFERQTSFIKESIETFESWGHGSMVGMYLA